MDGEVFQCLAYHCAFGLENTIVNWVPFSCCLSGCNVFCKCCGHWVDLSMSHHGFQDPFCEWERCRMALQLCWAALGSIATVMPWPIRVQSIAWKNEHYSCSRWDNCIRTFLSVNLVGSPSICSWNSCSRAQMSLLVTGIISLQNAACFCKSWSRLLRFLSFSSVANGASSSL